MNRIIGESDADVIIHTAAISDIGACQADPDIPARQTTVFLNMAAICLTLYTGRTCKSIHDTLCMKILCRKTPNPWPFPVDSSLESSEVRAVVSSLPAIYGPHL